MSNECTVLDAADDGLISWESVARECLANMSDDQIGTADAFLDLFEDEEDEEDEPEMCDECNGFVEFDDYINSTNHLIPHCECNED